MTSLFRAESSPRARSGIRSAVAQFLLAAAVLAVVTSWQAPQARAAGVYFSRAELLKTFFSGSDRVSFRTFDIDAAQGRRLAARLGYAVRERWTIYVGEKAGRVTGYAVLDEELGQHRPISFGVLLSPDGRVERVEVLVYREPKGEEVRRAQFRDQFVGKDAHAPVQAGRDIVAVSGATISSRSMAVGVRRALVIVDELALGGVTKTAAP